jgi:hypothetical protein
MVECVTDFVDEPIAGPWVWRSPSSNYEITNLKDRLIRIVLISKSFKHIRVSPCHAVDLFIGNSVEPAAYVCPIHQYAFREPRTQFVTAYHRFSLLESNLVPMC